MAFFSLIIPIYNVENFISICLDSCINQTFKDIEIICINDCSLDESYKILEKYADIDSRIKIITHDINKGLGGARNSGINIASGEYIWFIDSDDIISLDACELLYSVVIKNKVDIIRFNLINFLDNKNYRIGTYARVDKCEWPYNKIIIKEEHIKLNKTELTACTYVTSKDHIKKYLFREKSYHEDIDFTTILFSDAETIFCINSALYFRRLHKNSITGGGVLLQKRIIDSLTALEILLNYSNNLKLPKNHFCNIIIYNVALNLKKDYDNLIEINSFKYNSILSKALSYNNLYYKDKSIYNNIIDNFGNTKILIFILKFYRFIIKRINKYFK